MSERLVFDLDQQPPLPFKAADDYAATVLEWASVVPDGVVMERDIAYGPDRRQRYDVFAPPGASRAPILVFFHGKAPLSLYPKAAEINMQVSDLSGRVFFPGDLPLLDLIC